MKLNNIKSNPNNPRIIKDDKFKKLVKSLTDFPEMMAKRPIVCVTDTDGKLYPLGGNMRLKALQEIGHKEIPDSWITLADEWTQEQRNEFVIKDNVGFGEWDWDDLANNWDTDKLEEWGLDIPDFAVKELEAEEDDYEIPDEIKTDIVIGDLFEIGEHRLLCGDSTDSDQVAKLMNGEKADMVFTDPPYGVSYEGGHNKKKRKGIENDTLQGQDLTDLFYESLMNADLFSKDYSAFYIWYSTNKSVETFASFSRLNLSVRAVIAWYKVKSGLGSFMSQYIPNFEPCIYAFKNGKSPQWFGASDEKSVWELKKDSKNEYHPTQKPIELPSRAIENSSKLKDIIYDCFLGSGSTMVAAYQLKRKCYGMELDPKYCQVIVDRMLKLDPSLEVKRNGQPYEIKAQ
ncbi:MAG: DNA modification methylase [Bacteroidota bacterium]|jgi:DNA modification methylase